jgi:hypothetical protein
MSSSSSSDGDDAKPTGSTGTSGVVWFLIFFLLFSVLLMQFILFFRMSALRCEAAREATDAGDDDVGAASRGGDPRFRASAMPAPGPIDGVIVGEERVIHADVSYN